MKKAEVNRRSGEKKSPVNVAGTTYVKTRFLLGCALVSLGVLLATSGGNWDITNHLMNKPETFFSPPHALLYFGVGSALVGSAITYFSYRKIVNPDRATNMMAKFVFTGIALMVAAGPSDYAWHLAFGLDGLLSPTHLVLVVGMVLGSIGAMIGLSRYSLSYSPPDEHMKPRINILSTSKSAQSRFLALTIIGILPIWMAMSGLLYMFTLPFSNTQYFDFNPDPTFAAVFASLSFPFLISAVLYASFEFGGRRFGVLSVAGATFLGIGSVTAILPNESLIPTIPFYLMNMIPITVADTVLSLPHRRYSLYVAGSLLGASFLMIYYPMIVHTYHEGAVIPSLIRSTYFELIGYLYPLIVGPAVGMGIIGALAGYRMVRMLE